jgi:anti-sigma regulatory factor (Ser/Thr protein kinase)
VSQFNAVALPPSAGSAEQARTYVRHVGSGWPEHVREVCLLLASEVVTNAARYGRPPLVLHVDLDHAVLRVTVEQGTAALPHLHAQDPGPDAVRGRGLFIVAELADRWGSYVGDGGRACVWFEISFPR